MNPGVTWCQIIVIFIKWPQGNYYIRVLRGPKQSRKVPLYCNANHNKNTRSDYLSKSVRTTVDLQSPLSSRSMFMTPWTVSQLVPSPPQTRHLSSTAFEPRTRSHPTCYSTPSIIHINNSQHNNSSSSSSSLVAVSQHTRPQVDASLPGSMLTRWVRIVDVLLFSVCDNIVSARSSAASLAMCRFI